MSYIRHFKTITLQDVASVGGKNASLGQMITYLFDAGVKVPTGFAVTVQAYKNHLERHGLVDQIKVLCGKFNAKSSLTKIQDAGKKIRTCIEKAPLEKTLEDEILKAYQALCQEVGKKNCPVAVRSSATAEDLPDASFAGQQESFLYVRGDKEVIAAYKKSIASLFTDRAIMYRNQKGFDHLSVGISVGIQQMIHSDRACSGIIFTVDPESGFNQAIVIASSYGVGQAVVNGQVVPDEFHVFKKTLGKAHDPIIKKSCGSKKIKYMFSEKRSGIVKCAVEKSDRLRFSLTDQQVIHLATLATTIEQHYSQQAGRVMHMDIEWARDADDGHFYIVQARPETIHTGKLPDATSFKTYRIKNNQPLHILVQGQSVGQKIVTGKARVIKSLEGLIHIEEGEILITCMTDPDWVPLMKKSGGIITESGGRTCHAAIVSRELGIPALVGARGALKKIHNGQMITLDCSAGSQGTVYEGVLAVETQEIAVDSSVTVPVKVLLNIASPEHAYTHSFLPVSGVGLARLEFIITNMVEIHPMALAAPEKIKDPKIIKKIEEKTAAYSSFQEFFIKKMAEGIGMIAAAFFPRPVLVRFSDFKSNEYRGLLGGASFEPVEENPMMGLRGASRYYHELYAPAFALECQAISYAREAMGLYNINVMVPFVRTVSEAHKVRDLLHEQGLISQRNGLLVYMMCEIPSNVLLIEKFAEYFDGFSIGSNDLTQTTLSVDRDSGLLAPLFDERDEAVMKMLSLAIHGAHFAGRPIGICGQAPSDKREIAEFIIKEGIDSVSLNADSVLPFLRDFGVEKKQELVSKERSERIVPARVA